MGLQGLEAIQLSAQVCNGLGMRGSHSGKSLVESFSAR
jgi:hypothetical protein